MTNGGRPLICVLGVFVLWSATHVIAIDNSGTSPYLGIVERNVFGLKPPPPPPPRPEDNKPPPPKITLQGITTILGNKRVLMRVQMPARPPEPAKEVPLIMAEGQRDGDIEVLEINDKDGIVKVDNFGTPMSLDFTNNGIKMASAPAPGGPLGAPGFVPALGAKPFVPGGGATALPAVRPLRLPSAGAATVPGGYTPAPNTYTAVPAAPSYNPTPAIVAGGGVAPTTGGRQQNWPPEIPMTPEQQAIHDIAWTVQHQKEISQGLAPSIPGVNELLESQTPPAQTAPKPIVPAPQLPPGPARRLPY